MKNINKNIPTIQELRKKVEKEKLEFNADIEFDELGIKVVLNLLKHNKDFYNYLVNNNFSDFDLTTVVFSYIEYYILEKIEQNETQTVISILNYIESLLKTWDIEIENLIHTWLIENISQNDFNIIKPYAKELFIKQYKK